MKKEKQNNTYEGKQIYKILAKSDKLKRDIKDYISIKGIASGMYTCTSLYAIKGLIELYKKQPKSDLIADATFGALFAAIGVTCSITNKNYKKKINKDYKNLAKTVQNEEDFFTDKDGEKILSINGDINKLTSISSMISAVEGLIFAGASFVLLTGLNAKSNYDMKTKLYSLALASVYYLIGGGLLYLNKKNADQIDYRTGMLANNLMKPYTTNEKTLKRK